MMQEIASDHLEALPLEAELKRRIAIGLSCADCQSIPKVPRAGETFSDADGRYQLMHNGIKVVEDGYCGKWMTELIKLARGHHEPQEERVFFEILKHLTDRAVMIELGSYWAYYSLWFDQQIRDAQIHLVEPDPNHLAVGRHNFALNGARGSFYQYSVGRAPADPQPFACESDNLTRHIPAVSVDDFVERNNLPSVDLLFADIQGAELSMLEGATTSIAQGKIRFLFLSTHHHSISNDPLTHQKCLEFLRARRAHIIAAHNVTESYSGDGLIVASFRGEDRFIGPIEISRNHPTNSLFRELEYDLDEAQQAIKSLRHHLRLKTETDSAPSPGLIQRIKSKLKRF